MDIGQVHFLWRSINLKKKKERGQCPVILAEQVWSIKDLLSAFGQIFPAGHSG